MLAKEVDDSTLRQQGLMVLGQLGHDPMPEVRETAALRLADLGQDPQGTVQRLRQILRDGDMQGRRQAIEKLGELGPAARSTVPDLLEITRGYGSMGTTGDAVLAAHALARICPQDAPVGRQLAPILQEELAKAISSGHPVIIARACEPIGAFGPDVPALRTAVHAAAADPQRCRRLSFGALPLYQALAHASRDAPPTHVLRHLEAMASGNPPIKRVQHQALNVLAEFGPRAQESVPVLLDVLTDRSRSSEKAYAARAIGCVAPQDERAQDALRTLLEDGDADGSTRFWAAWSLSRADDLPTPTRVAVRQMIEAAAGDDAPDWTERFHLPEWGRGMDKEHARLYIRQQATRALQRLNGLPSGTP